MSEYSPLQARDAVLKALANKVKSLSADLARLAKAEAEGFTMEARAKDLKKSEVHKTVFQVLSKAETFISNAHPAEPGKRDVTKGKPGPNLPEDRKEKSVSASGSGGQLTKAAGDPASPTAKPAMPTKPPAPKMGATMKPAGVPGAKVGAAPSIPTPPKAPGAAGMVKKNEPVGVFAKLKLKKGY
jgi:hypothetical protein